MSASRTTDCSFVYSVIGKIFDPSLYYIPELLFVKIITSTLLPGSLLRSVSFSYKNLDGLFEYSTRFVPQGVESPSNIVNGLGIFTGVSSDTLYLEVIKI